MRRARFRKRALQKERTLASFAGWAEARPHRGGKASGLPKAGRPELQDGLLAAWMRRRPRLMIDSWSAEDRQECLSHNGLRSG